MKSTRELIDVFLAHKRLAIVGVSRNERDFTRVMFRAFAERGYEVVPVNPRVAEIDGRACYRHLQEINPPVSAALIMTTPSETEAVVQDCVKAGIKLIWLYRAVGKGAVSENAISFCAEHSIEVIPGYCPYMFFPDAGFGHRLHGMILKLTGRYPK